MRSLSQASARYMILMVAAGYIVLFGLTESARHFAVIDPLTADELLKRVTTLASLTVGAVLGFHLASRPRQS